MKMPDPSPPHFRGKAAPHANFSPSSRVNPPLGCGVSQLSPHRGMRFLGKTEFCCRRWDCWVPPVPGGSPPGWVSQMSGMGLWDGGDYTWLTNADVPCPQVSSPMCICRSQDQYWWSPRRPSPSPALCLDSLLWAITINGPTRLQGRCWSRFMLYGVVDVE